MRQVDSFKIWLDSTAPPSVPTVFLPSSYFYAGQEK